MAGAVAGQRARRAGRRDARRRRDHGHRAVRLRAAARHERHARHRRQPERHDHRHQPHRRPAPRPRRGGARHRQPALERPHRQGRRRALHVRRARRGDERRVDQGVLRPGRGRDAAGLRDQRGGRLSAPPQRRHELLDRAAAAARCDARRCSPRREVVAEAARRFAPTKRYWAVVGNGANKVAAEEVRIKLSELCYKSIACDVTEDKKHIDLSSEPMILVCAAGLAGSTADDVEQGGRHLPGPQGDADRDRRRRRRPLRRRRP